MNEWIFLYSALKTSTQNLACSQRQINAFQKSVNQLDI